MRVCGMRPGISISVTPADLDRLRTLVKDRNAPQKHVWRAQIILLSAESAGTNAIIRATGKSKTCVWRWQERFAAEGVDGLLRDKTRPSRIPKLDRSVAERVVALTMETPPHEATHWTGSAMAGAARVSVSSVQRIWRAHGLQPHQVRQFKLSNDPAFVEKLRDIVGLYVDPPAHAVVLSVDEKSQIQALDRTQPGLPLKKGRAGTMTHDYKRNGTTTLSSDAKCNTPRRFGIGKVVQDLKECCHAILFASVRGRKRPDRRFAGRGAVDGGHCPGARSGESHHLQGAPAERTPLGRIFAASRRRSLSIAQGA